MGKVVSSLMLTSRGKKSFFSTLSESCKMHLALMRGGAVLQLLPKIGGLFFFFAKIKLFFSKDSLELEKESASRSFRVSRGFMELQLSMWDTHYM